MSILRHGAMGKTFAHSYALSTLGSFLRSFKFGHVRQLEAFASRFLAERTPLLAGIDDLALVDLNDTVVEVYGYGKQGASFGYTGVRASTHQWRPSPPPAALTRVPFDAARDAWFAAVRASRTDDRVPNSATTPVHAL